MRTFKLVAAAVIAAAALAAGAEPRSAEGGPFTYEALGATPSVKFGRNVTSNTAAAPKAAAYASAGVKASSSTTATQETPRATPLVQPTKDRAEGLARRPAS